MTSALLDTFTLANFAITLRPDSELFLPGYKGAAFRGGFGYVFKSIVCPTHDTDCIHARLGERCIYSEVFETPVPPESAVMRKYPHAPHPLLLRPPRESNAVWSWPHLPEGTTQYDNRAPPRRVTRRASDTNVPLYLPFPLW